MQRMKLGFLIVLALMLGAGCLLTNSDLSKADARREIKEGSDSDYCDIYGWYGDGTCDDFCTDPDPDCDAECKALPTCTGNEFEVESCEDREDCNTRELCGTTVYCQEENDVCTAYPSCAPGFVEVDQCVPDAECVEESICEATIFCVPEEVCGGEATCPDGYSPQACDTSDDACKLVDFCGTMISCLRTDVCEALEICPEGTLERESCEGADGECETMLKCGHEIGCEIPVCDMVPMCEDNYTASEEPCNGAENCFSETVCDITIYCYLNP
jgi:hypothetical protein